MTWTTVTATLPKTPDDWSPWVEIFRAYGCENTIQTDVPPTLGGAVVSVEGAEAVVQHLVAALTGAGAQHVAAEPLEEQDWDEVWRRHFKPRRIGQRLVVRPTWETFEKQPGDIEIVLDPGQAFGTGDHPTTRMCLELLEGLELQGKRVADIGCGSGILSIGADKLGASEVLGIDIEPLSVEVARENATLNSSASRFQTGNSIQALGGTFDLIVSNIISAVLINMAPDFASHLRPAGMWIASGIIEQNWPDVEAAANREGFSVQAILRQDGWVAAKLLLS